ncbi:MAG: ribosome maturation factor RimP [Geodermatophilaceae bacterium]|nr:ribosome maturation factor RimP [Geodermatophilaceae bacterium]
MSARSAQHDRLVAVVDPLVRAAGYDLEQLVVTPAGRRILVRVVVDGDTLTLDDVATLSRDLSEALDGEVDDGFGATAYVLEVTSPGVDRPLTLPRHWRRAAGRLVSIKLGGGAQETVKGRVRSSDDHGVLLDVDGVDRTVAFTDVSSARVEVEFSRSAGTERDGQEQT